MGGRIPTRWLWYDRDDRDDRLSSQIGCSCLFPKPALLLGFLPVCLSFTELIPTQKVVVAPWPQLWPQWPQVWPHGFTGVIRTQKVVVAPWPQLWPQWHQVWPHGFAGEVRTQKVAVAPLAPAVAPWLHGRGTHSKSCCDLMARAVTPWPQLNPEPKFKNPKH